MRATHRAESQFSALLQPALQQSGMPGLSAAWCRWRGSASGCGQLFQVRPTE